MDLLLRRPQGSTKPILIQPIKDIDLRYSLACADRNCSPLCFGLHFNFPEPANYLYQITAPRYSFAFSTARFNCFPSGLSKGRFNNTPYGERICPCGKEIIETLAHIILECSLYRIESIQYLGSLMTKCTSLPLTSYLKCLLPGSNNYTVSG